MVDASLRMEIVNVFRKLRDEQRVSVLYITHDLATAYYISDRIAIMLRGFIVESGPVEAVLDRPLHPYTRLLKESVPERRPRSASCGPGTFRSARRKSKSMAASGASSRAAARR